MSYPSLYDILYGNFAGGLDLNTVSGTDQAILLVLGSMQRILNCRAGTLAHLPDYGLPDMTATFQGMPVSTYQLMSASSAVSLKYEPYLQRIAVMMPDQYTPGKLCYAINAELKDIGLVRYDTELMPEGRMLTRHLKHRQYLGAHSAL